MAIWDFLSLALIGGIVVYKWNDIQGLLNQLGQAASGGGQQPQPSTGTQPTDQSNPQPQQPTDQTGQQQPQQQQPPGPGISVPGQQAIGGPQPQQLSRNQSGAPSKKKSSTKSTAPPVTQQAVASDPCAPLKASSPSSYAFCRQQRGLPPTAVGFGGVYDNYYDYDYGDSYGYEY